MQEMFAEPDVKKLILLIPQKERHLGSEVAAFQYLKASNKENGIKLFMEVDFKENSVWV